MAGSTRNSSTWIANNSWSRKSGACTWQVASAGDNEVGGDEFDSMLRNPVRTKHAAQHGMIVRAAGVRFVAADMPEANEMVVGIMAVVAQAERKMISTRTKAALGAAKARGVKLGGARGGVLTAEAIAAGQAARSAKARTRAADLDPIIADIRSKGAVSLRQIAAELNERGIPTPRGSSWNAVQVQRVIKQAAEAT